MRSIFKRRAPVEDEKTTVVGWASTITRTDHAAAAKKAEQIFAWLDKAGSDYDRQRRFTCLRSAYTWWLPNDERGETWADVAHNDISQFITDAQRIYAWQTVKYQFDKAIRVGGFPHSARSAGWRFSFEATQIVRELVDVELWHHDVIVDRYTTQGDASDIGDLRDLLAEAVNRDPLVDERSSTQYWIRVRRHSTGQELAIYPAK